MRTSREELRDTGSVETSLSETKGCAQTSSSSTNDNGIVLVVDNGILAGNEPRGLLCLQVLGRKDTSSWPCRRESSRWCADALRELWRYWLAIVRSACEESSHCNHTSLMKSLKSLGILVGLLPQYCGMCGTHLGAEGAGYSRA